MKNNRMFAWAVWVWAVCLFGAGRAGAADYPRVVVSADGVPISYQVQGQGEVALVFVHGWSGDSRYWRNQIEPFSRQYKVITLDLAGHGHSGMGRKESTMQAFGEDVKAVVEDQKADRVILIGHSMSGEIIAEAARLMPGKALALVGVDTLQNIEMPLPKEEEARMLEPLERDFRSGAQAFVAGMFVEGSDPAVKEWVIQDISSAPAPQAISAMRQYLGLYARGEAAARFEGLDVPVYCINATLWPNDAEANRRHMKSYELVTIQGTGHFPMLEKPAEFNALLSQILEKILRPAGEK